MKIRVPLVLLVITALVMGVLHILAIELSLYWQYRWLDIPMHILGGTSVALAASVWATLDIPFSKQIATFRYTLLCVLAVGVAWELFELWAGIAIERDYVQDTATDLLMDLVGGVIGYIVGSRTARL